MKVSEKIIKLLIIIPCILFLYVFFTSMFLYFAIIRIFKKGEYVNFKLCLFLKKLFINFFPIKEISHIYYVIPFFYLKKSKIGGDSGFISWKNGENSFVLDFDWDEMWYINDGSFEYFKFSEFKNMYVSKMQPILKEMYKIERRDYLIKELL